MNRMNHISAPLLAVALALSAAFGIPPSPARAEGGLINIGVLAFRGDERTVARWQPTAEYLSRWISDRTVTIVPLSLNEMTDAVSAGTIDFILTNPGNYVDMEARFGATRIATLQPSTIVPAENVFGAVIVVRADNDNIKNLSDLKGASFMAVGKQAFGGFQMAWREMEAAGVDPFDDLAAITYSGFPQDQIIQAIIDGKVDAGTVRTGVIESMAREARVDPAALRVLGQRRETGFPYRLSTQLYPEWPFAKLRHASPELAQRVVIALLAMTAEDPAARAGGYAGWTVPLDYQPVHELFRELRIGPYGGPVVITFDDLVGQYWHWGLFASILLLIAVLWVVRVEHLVSRRTAELSSSNRELERQILERKRAEETAQRRQNELTHISRVNTMGELTASLAHEINQPLSAIANFAQGCVRRLQRGDDDSDALMGAMRRVTQEADRASEVIRRIRSLVRKSEPELTAIHMNDIIAEVLDITAAERMRHNIETALSTAPVVPVVMADRIQIEQVLLNLIGNAIDAVKTHEGPRQLVISTAVINDSDLCISVTDNGPGLPAKDVDKLFNLFYTTKPDGMGMGLAISHTIIEASGGRLWAEHGPGGGAVFSFTLPSANVDQGSQEENADNAA